MQEHPLRWKVFLEAAAPLPPPCHLQCEYTTIWIVTPMGTVQDCLFALHRAFGRVFSLSKTLSRTAGRYLQFRPVLFERLKPLANVTLPRFGDIPENPPICEQSPLARVFHAIRHHPAKKISIVALCV